MKKISIKAAALFLAVVSLLASVSCDIRDIMEKDTQTQTESESESQIVSEIKKDFNDYLAIAPVSWNPHTCGGVSDNYVSNLLGTALYGFSLNENGDGFEIIPEGAYGEPVDVTEKYVGNEIYGVPEDAEHGYAYTVMLNRNMRWSDGTAITAQTYINSAKQLLESDMKNKNASLLFENRLCIANAEKYYNNDVASQPVYTPVYDGNMYADVDPDELYFSFTVPSGFFGDYSAADYYEAGYVSYFCTEEGEDLFLKYKDDEYVKLTDEITAELQTIASNFQKTAENAYLRFCFYISDNGGTKTEWENVGIISGSEYELTFILSSQISAYDFKYALTTCWIIKENIYIANKFDEEGKISTLYGTDVGKTASCGPYILNEINSEGTFVFEKNSEWYGYSDGKHTGQYPADTINCRIISDHEYAHSLYKEGKLDVFYPDSSDIEEYYDSENLKRTPTPISARLSFNSDYAMLKSRQEQLGSGYNKTLLSYRDFREAISLSIDRERFCKTLMRTAVPAKGIVSDYYIYGTDNGFGYRNVVEGIFAKFDKSAATALFESAYAAAKEAGDISDNDIVELEFLVYNSDEAYINLVNFFESSINDVCFGTPLYGRIKLKAVANSDYYGYAKEGKSDIILVASKGTSRFPLTLLRSYVDPGVIYEYGFIPTIKTMTLNVNGNDTTMTLYGWYLSAVNGEYESDTMKIFSELEKAILSDFCTVPIYDSVSCAVYSDNISFPFKDEGYVVNIGYGVRYMSIE